MWTSSKHRNRILLSTVLLFFGNAAFAQQVMLPRGGEKTTVKATEAAAKTEDSSIIVVGGMPAAEAPGSDSAIIVVGGKPNETVKAPGTGGGRADSVLLNPQPLPPKPDVSRQATPPVSSPPKQQQRSPSQAADTAVRAAPGASTKAVLPDNLFSLNDRAIIVVGGKEVRAGDIKRELHQELAKLSGPPKTIRSPSRTVAPAKASASLGKQAAAKSASTHLNDLGARAMDNPRTYCDRNPPRITRVRGNLTPNQRFTIDGVCFGEKTGTVEVIGQFPGGNMKLSFERWSTGEIIAFVPAVRGAGDHAVAVTVVRPDKTRTAAAQASFVATRERVEVPGNRWSPGSRFEHTNVDQLSGVLGIPFGAEHGSPVTPFKLSVNQACALDNAAWTQTVGRVDAFDGWEKGPPHEANVDIKWTPQCTRTTTNYVIAGSIKTVCRIVFDVKAWAHCPLGIAP